MKIGIVGPAERTQAWEKYLRPHQSVTEVILAATVDEIGPVDTCFLLDDGPGRIDHLLTSIKAGYHTFFISKLPTNVAAAKKIYHISQEANVCIQFSHWPTLAPASQWMHQQIKRPAFIQITKHLRRAQVDPHNVTFRDLWVDELAYCVKYIGSPVHHFQVNSTKLSSGKKYALHILLHFDNGAAATIDVLTCARHQVHFRLISDHNVLLNCEVEDQTVIINRERHGRLHQNKETFDSSVAAEKAVSQFLKSIQLHKRTLFNSYDLLQTADVVDKIESRLL